MIRCKGSAAPWKLRLRRAVSALEGAGELQRQCSALEAATSASSPSHREPSKLQRQCSALEAATNGCGPSHRSISSCKGSAAPWKLRQYARRKRVDSLPAAKAAQRLGSCDIRRMDARRPPRASVKGSAAPWKLRRLEVRRQRQRHRPGSTAARRLGSCDSSWSGVVNISAKTGAFRNRVDCD